MTDLLTPERLETLLTEYGWTFERVSEGCWRTGFAGEQRYYPLHIELTETCVGFAIDPFLELDSCGRTDASLARELLELSDGLRIVKLGLGEGGDVTLSCQALAAGFGLDALTSILGVVGHYADALTVELAAAVDRGGATGLLLS